MVQITSLRVVEVAAEVDMEILAATAAVVVQEVLTLAVMAATGVTKAATVVVGVAMAEIGQQDIF